MAIYALIRTGTKEKVSKNRICYFMKIDSKWIKVITEEYSDIATALPTSDYKCT